MKVYSYLDEPLSVEIELTDLGDIDPEQIIVTLGNANEFLRAGLQRPYFLTTINFAINSIDSRKVLYITSGKVVKEPYLEFIVNVSWLTGTLVKRITVLIDPPPSNLSNASRQLSLSEKAYKEQETKQFGNAKLPATVKQEVITPKPQDNRNRMTKFSDETMVDPYGPEAGTPIAAPVNPDGSVTVPPGPTPLTPTPQAADPVTQIPPPATRTPVVPIAPVTATPLTPAPLTAAPVTQMPPPTNPPSISPVPVAPVAPVQVTPAPLSPASSAPVMRQIPRNITAQANTGFLTQAVERLKAVDSDFGTDIDLNHLAAERKKHSDMFRDDSETPNTEIDFGDVIKPAVKGSTTGAPDPGAAGLSHAPGGRSMPGAMGMPGSTPPSMPSAAAESSHNGLYLIIAGFVLGITAAVAFVIKKGIYKKYLPSAHSNHAVADFADDFVTQDHGKFDLDMDEDFSTIDIDKQEEIELSTVSIEKPDKITDLDLDKFEDELNMLEGNRSSPKLSTDRSATATFKSMSELLNIPMSDKDKATSSPSASLKKAVKKEEPSKVEETVKIEEPVKVEETIKIEEPIKKAEKIDLTDEPLKFDIDSLQLAELKNNAEDIPPMAEVHEIVETMAPITEPISTSGLRLEGDPIIPDTSQVTPVEAAMTPEQEAIKLKLDLAKQYLEAGDKESARGVLNEIIEVAKDTQKLEAELMLSGIL